MPAVLTASDARHWALLTRAALAARRTEIDALNVFPVPDGDTGTNLYLTFDAAIDEVVSAHEAAGILGEATLVQECRTLKRAILLSARGNSGVIVSQLVGGLCDAVIERDAEVVDALLLADAFAAGAAAARACVAHPQEGTILSVADAGAAAAVEAAEAGGSLADVCEAAVDAAQEALTRTPEQLEALARAGVVDAGGAGLRAHARVVPPGGHRALDRHRRRAAVRGPDPGPARRVAPTRSRRRPVGSSADPFGCRAGPPPAHHHPARARPARRGRPGPRRGSGLRGHVPAHRRHPRGGGAAHRPRSTGSATHCSSSGAPTSGTCTCTSTTRVPPSRRG